MTDLEKLYCTDSKVEALKKINAIIENGTGGGLEICDIGMALYIDESKGKRRWLNGQIVAINDNTQAFLNRLKEIQALHPSLFTTEDNWQAVKTLSDFGQVGLFVIDEEAGTIRIPAVVNVQGLFDLQNLGLTVAAGLPNIEGTIEFRQVNTGGGDVCFGNGSFTRTMDGDGYVSGLSYTASSNKGTVIHHDASLSNPIYGNSDTVQPEAIQYPYFIQIATGQETEAEIVNEIELNNPYSLGDSKYSPVALNNISWLKSEGQYNPKGTYTDYYDWLLRIYNGTETVEGVSVKLVTEEYTDYDWVLNTTDETFRLPLLDGSEDLPSGRYDELTLGASGDTYTAPANGWYFVSITHSATTGYMYLLNVESNVALTTKAVTSSGHTETNIFLKQGQTLRIGYSDVSTANAFRFIYAQGNGSLYYYVGETVQNANLVNIGRIEENMATKSMVDGQWVYSYLQLGTSYGTYSLADYLPNDGFNYNVKFAFQCYESADAMTVKCATDIFPNTALVIYGGSYSRQNAQIFDMPVGTGRSITISGSYGDSSYFKVIGYRRLGTNT